MTGRCPPDNGFIYYRELDLCFNLNDGVYMNFNSIVKPICTAVGAEMVRVDSEERNSFIMKIVGKLYLLKIRLRNKSWKPECVLSFNIGWQILVFYPEPEARSVF